MQRADPVMSGGDDYHLEAARKFLALREKLFQQAKQAWSGKAGASAIRLTVRDFEILEFLFAQGLATPLQIRERFFCSRTSCDKRLHFLAAAGLVESRSVKELKVKAPRSSVDVPGILEIGNPHLAKYRVFGLGPRFRNRRQSKEFVANPLWWQQQIQINRLKKFCSDWFPGAKILANIDVRQEHYRVGGAQDVVTPVLAIRIGNLEIAIEWERSFKSPRVYFERFRSYQSSAYTHVVYFCETEDIFKKVADLAANFKKIAVTSVLMNRIVFQERTGFRRLQDFLGTAATISTLSK